MQTEESNPGGLPAPVLRQAPDGKLDLGNIGTAVSVLIPPYPQAGLGDRILVSFSAAGNDPVYCYYYLSTYISEGYEVRFQVLSDFKPIDYEVSYMVTSRSGNDAHSPFKPVTVFGVPPTPVSSIAQMSAVGRYLPGLLDSWVVAEDYDLAMQDVLWRALGESDVGTVIVITQAPENGQPKEIMRLTCSGSVEWKITPGAQDNVHFSHGDLVEAIVDGNEPRTVRLALCL